MKRTFIAILVAVGLLLSGCSTSAWFIIPDNTLLVVHGKRAVPKGKFVVVKSHPFFWTSFHGIDYQLIRKDSVVRKGKLPASFRIASLFWPPYAFFYWPAGFQFNCYDLTKAVPMDCGSEIPHEKPNPSETGQPWMQ